MDEARRQLARHLLGTGIEVGPGHQPFPIAFPGVTIRYFDRWQPDESRALYPELECASQTGEGASYTRIPFETDGERAAWFDWHRKRSIHVHCWTEDEFLEVLLHAIATMGHRWEFVDGIIADDEGEHGIEFGYVLRRSTLAFDPSELAERFDATWRAWCAERRALHTRWDEADQRLTSCSTDIPTLQTQA